MLLNKVMFGLNLLHFCKHFITTFKNRIKNWFRP